MTPEELSSVMHEIASRNDGMLDPEQIVDSARHPDHPLHGEFEWNDTVAAHKHRLHQARTLIRRVKLQVTHMPLGARPPAFVRHPQSTRSYVAITKAKSDEDVSRDILINEFRRILAALRRAKAIAAVLAMDSDVGEVEALMIALLSRVEKSAGDDAAGSA